MHICVGQGLEFNDTKPQALTPVSSPPQALAGLRVPSSLSCVAHTGAVCIIRCL